PRRLGRRQPGNATPPNGASPCKPRTPALIEPAMTVPAGRMPAVLAPRRRSGARPRLAPKRRHGRVRARVEYLALRVVMGLLGALPLSLALRLGELGALLAYAFDVPHRRIGMVNLGLAFPEPPLRERRGLLRRASLTPAHLPTELPHLP